MSDTAPTGAAVNALIEPATPASTPNTPPTPTIGARNDTQTQWTAPDWAKDWPAEDLGRLEKKGYKDPKDIFKAYSELERTLGQDKIPLPKGDDPKEWDPVYNKLGRPESADKYVAPKDADPDMFKALAPELHGAGLNQKQVEKIAAAQMKYNADVMAKLRDAWVNDQNAAQAKLEREWGPQNTPKEIEHNRRAMRAVGMTVEEATEYMKAGSEKFLRALNLAGHAIAEDNSGDIASDSTLGFGLTPNRAAAELNELKGNKEFMTRVYQGDPAAREKYNRLVSVTSEGGMVRRTIKSGYKPTA